MITYRDTIDGIAAEQLIGFFVGWPSPPSPATHLRILAQSTAIVLAVASETDQVVGFVTAISDGVSCAYIPHLEVLPGYQGRGIGSDLMRRMLGKLQQLYMIDLMCDPDVEPFYERLGMRRSTGMLIRNFAHQAGGRL